MLGIRDSHGEQLTGDRGYRSSMWASGILPFSFHETELLWLRSPGLQRGELQDLPLWEVCSEDLDFACHRIHTILGIGGEKEEIDLRGAEHPHLMLVSIDTEGTEHQAADAQVFTGLGPRRKGG
ncbi:putative tRNA pseudouridine synthase 2 [Platysternon megacephalum]|uniref:Putative tRNA pseudouridine synthase 2 n=1 Tax=Platysternon megacephalum TaxID=55544 RepID=A0A4D9EF18_9SAUR|nr:putative tRNA pseudouridine synthase 2 [Platysternon megacephalum]